MVSNKYQYPILIWYLGKSFELVVMLFIETIVFYSLTRMFAYNGYTDLQTVDYKQLN